MNVCLIVVPTWEYIHPIMHVSAGLKNLNVYGQDRFMVGKDWSFVVIPKTLLKERVRGMLLNKVVVYDAWLLTEERDYLFATMRSSWPEITYIDDLPDLRQYVVETCRAQEPE